MKSKIKAKSYSQISSNQNKNKTKENNYSKKFNKNRNAQKNSKNNNNLKSTNRIKPKQNNNNIINIEDSSTSYFSKNNKKNMIPKFDYNLINNKKKDILPIPLLIPKESETESFFINFKLGENDSYTESTIRNDLKQNNINNLKLNNNKSKNYNYCNVDKNIGQNENDSMEIYDFTDKTNVDYVLKNLSVLSYSKSVKDKSSFILDDFNEEENENKQKINQIKIFNTKQIFSNKAYK